MSLKSSAQPLVVVVPHRLGRQAARDRLESGLTRIRSEVAAYAASVDSHWSNDHLVFSVRALGRTFTGKVDVLDDAVRLEVDLPWLLSLAAKTIVAHIRHTGTFLLRK